MSDVHTVSRTRVRTVCLSDVDGIGIGSQPLRRWRPRCPRSSRAGVHARARICVDAHTCNVQRSPTCARYVPLTSTESVGCHHTVHDVHAAAWACTLANTRASTQCRRGRRLHALLRVDVHRDVQADRHAGSFRAPPRTLANTNTRTHVRTSTEYKSSPAPRVPSTSIVMMSASSGGVVHARKHAHAVASMSTTMTGVHARHCHWYVHAFALSRRMLLRRCSSRQ